MMRPRSTVLLLLLGALAACAVASENGDGGSDAAADSSAADVNPSSDVATDTSPGNDSGKSDSGAACGSYAYCEDFETYSAGAITNGANVGPWLATVMGFDVKMQIDAASAYKSGKGLHVSVPSNAGMDAGTQARATLNQMSTGGLVAGNDMYGRAMVFYSNSAGNDLPLGVHSWLFNSAGFSDVADGGVTMNMGGGGMKMQLNYHPPPPLTEQSVDDGGITAGAWHCIQWQYDGSGSGSSVADVGKVWVDGTLAVDVPKTKGWNFATPWKSMDFGFTHYQALANPVDVYLDDFAIDASMVPCPP